MGKACKMPRTPGCLYVASHTWPIGRSVVPKPLRPSPAQNLFLDCRKIFEAERYGNCSTARCFSTEKAGETSMFYWTPKGTAQTR